ncbi:MULTISPECIES: papain-like cysteine protease family protein [Pseudomonas]|nr:MULTISPECIES: hypothetical protein [Pseudomonas]
MQTGTGRLRVCLAPSCPCQIIKIYKPEVAMAVQEKDAIQRRDEALNLARKFGLCPDSQNKAWAMDQMCRILLGDEYPVWVAETEAGADGATWETGTAPVNHGI